MASKKTIVVLHKNPDLEALTMLWLISRFKDIAEKVGVTGEVEVKFIATGPLRKEDWPWVKDTSNLNGQWIEANSPHVFMDCGGGSLDQHGQDAFGHNNVSSLQLLTYRASVDESYAELMPLLGLISANDLSAQDVAARHDYRHSPTPNTPRHIRNMVAGWNLLHPGDPHLVADWALAALDCIYAGIEKDLSDGVDRSANERTLYSNVFLLAHRAGQEGLAREVAESGERALDALEAEWARAVKDYWGPKCHGYPVRTAEGFGITFVVGESRSTRFGQVTRLGNVGKNRPEPKRDFRPKADVTLQWHGGGRFVVSSRKTELDGVVAALRRADHVKRFGKKPDEVTEAAMSRRGEYVRPDGVVGLYAAEHGKCVGNAFFSNGMTDPTVLTFSEVTDIVREALAR